ncbi:MAG: hypothetical protein H7A46_12155 [Verrucomicrobiales bacterium]|nr:hypothetical protein [Verrucomicrobiales bacterium]
MKPKDILNFVGYSAVGVGAMLLLIHLLGEVHGLISSMVIFIVQAGFLFTRIGALERELRDSRHPAEERPVQ